MRRNRTTWRSAPSGPDGLIGLEQLPAEHGPLDVVALGHATERITLEPPGSAPSPTARDDEPVRTVTLTPCASVLVSVVFPDPGSGPTGAALHLTLPAGSGAPFPEGTTRPEVLRASLGAATPTSGGWSASRPSTLVFPLTLPSEPGDPHTVRLECLRPDQPFTLHLEDPYGGQLRPPATVLLAPGEAWRETWHVDRAPATRLVEVVDPWGAPIAGAMVSLDGQGLRSDRSRFTDGNGVAHFPGAYGHRVRGHVKAAGFVPGTLDAERHDPASGPLSITLMPSRTLLLEVRGHPDAVDGTRRASVWSGDIESRGVRRGTSSSLSPGPEIVEAPPTDPAPPSSSTFTLRDIPADEPVTVQLTALGRVLAFEVPAVVTEHTVTLPPTGSLDISWTPQDLGTRPALRLQPLEPDTASSPGLRITLDEAALSQGHHRVPTLFPGLYQVSLTTPTAPQDPEATIHPHQTTFLTLQD